MWCAQTPVGVVPNVALKFDYSQTVGSPLVSVYYTDRRCAPHSAHTVAYAC